MDATWRTLLLEVARTVVRVLDEEAPKALNKRTPGVVAKINATLANAPTVDEAWDQLLDKIDQPERGDAVRVWAGDRYETGVVKSVCRGEPRKVWVSISRGEGRRGKKVRVESAKAVIVKKGG